MPLKRIFFFTGDKYWRYEWTRNGGRFDNVDPAYPRQIAGPWPGLFGSAISAAFCWRNGKVYFFSGDQYCRYDALLDRVDPGYPKSIGDNWGGVAEAGFATGIDAAVHWGTGQVYWFKGDQYIRLSNTGSGWQVDAGYPKNIAANWPGVAGTVFERDIAGCVNWGDGKIHWFKGDQYARFSEQPGIGKAMDAGYPRAIAGAWPGVPTHFDACVEWPYAELAPGGLNLPSGAQTVFSAGGRKQASFAMNLDFHAPADPATCAVGEYRQLVRGAFTHLGVDQRFNLAHPGGGAPIEFHRTQFREDGLANPGTANTFYGHRAPKFGTDQAGTGDGSDQYLPDRLTGCQYRGADAPGLPDVAGNGLSAEFSGEVWDRGTNELLVSSTFTVTIPE